MSEMAYQSQKWNVGIWFFWFIWFMCQFESITAQWPPAILFCFFNPDSGFRLELHPLPDIPDSGQQYNIPDESRINEEDWSLERNWIRPEMNIWYFHFDILIFWYLDGFLRYRYLISLQIPKYFWNLDFMLIGTNEFHEKCHKYRKILWKNREKSRNIPEYP